jgi:cobalt/nickel transport system ATP-binding protein
MYDFRDKPPYHLSYGQKKRVAIAGVLAMRPQVIVLDEPVAYLDPKGKETLMEILDGLHAAGTTVMIATHDVDLAAEWASQVIIIKNGVTLAAGDNSLLNRDDIVQAAELRYPVVAQIFRQLPELGLSKLPLTIKEAVETIKEIYCKQER